MILKLYAPLFKQNGITTQSLEKSSIALGVSFALAITSSHLFTRLIAIHSLDPRQLMSMLVYPWVYLRRCGGKSARNCLPASGISHGTSME